MAIPKYSKWTTNCIPKLNGKLIVVTGGNGGLGLETALVLAQKLATVILIGRNEEKGKSALRRIKNSTPDANVSFEKVDLANLASVSEFASLFNSQHSVLDILINNAGVSYLLKRETTEEGYEKTFATNHLGHFALTALLLPALKRSAHARVINVASLSHRWGTKINFDDLHFEKSYNPISSYSQSKLANLLFTLQLQKRSDEGNWGLFCVAAHPGAARTDSGPSAGVFVSYFRRFIESLFCQSAADGARPILYAATSPDAEKGGFYGPKGFYEMRGEPVSAYRAPEAKDEDVAKRLWEVSVTLTGAKWN